MHVSFESYPVSGLTREELRQSLLANGPVDTYGLRRFAYADWHIEWKWKLTPHGLVDASTIELSCSATVDLPRLVPVHGMSQELIQQWLSFVERLRTHEMNHIRHGQERAGLVLQSLRVASARRRGLTPAEADSVAQWVMYEIRELDRRYDEMTNHGKTEGAWEL